uniref:U3 small nucleolar RNA-associated protein 25 homolog n=1 Tax=Moina brachiata TaxID=675436 RepID=A0A4Y7NK78_9CRUS|nr:EOG090X05RM [Moina brachiata]
MFKGSSKVQVVSSDEEESDEEQGAINEAGDEEVEEEGSEEESLDEDIDSEDVQDEQESDCEASEEGEPVQEDSDADEEETDQNTDNFHMHFEKEMSENVLECLTSPKPYETKELQWKALGRMVVYLPKQTEQQKTKPKTVLGDSSDDFVAAGSIPVLKPQIPLKSYGVRAQLCANLDKRPLAEGEDAIIEDLLSPLQLELFTLANEYKDIYFPEVKFTNIDEVRTVYCLHALNHALKSRDKVLAHNAKLKKISESGGQTNDVEFRDQGLVRPRVLIVCPLRNSAVKIVDKLASLLLPKKGQLMNKKRFDEEFLEEKDEDGKPLPPKKNNKPEDYDAIFTGNIDDSFRIGVSVSKRTLRLYTGFYMSDILIASPLGIRTLLEEDFDFLSSIEVLIMDQTDVLYMQNWDHVLQLYDHLHLQPREQHGTDLSRVRLWALNGYSAHYRQNLIFSSVALPEAAALFTRRGTNFAGKVRIENAVAPTAATVCHVVVQLPQAFHKFPTTAATQSADDRFQFFTRKILPQYRDVLMSNTLIYVPSYYDYVRLRNFMHKEEYNFGQACEYTPDGKLAQVRNRFFLGKKRLLLYTERLHFFRRLTVKGIHHIIFYQLPTYPHFYAELCNLLQDTYQSKKHRGDNSQTCTVLYSTFDAPRMSAVVGSKRAAEMITSDRPVHLFVSGGS